MPTLISFAGVGIEGGMSLLRYMGTRDGWSLAGQRSAVAIVALMIVGAASSNLFHYVDWQSQPRTREARYLYLTIGEFPDWGAAIRERARDGEGVLTVGQWREMYPIEDRGNPYAAAP
jgi:hypothetical protein